MLVSFFPLTFIIKSLIIFRPDEFAITLVLALEPRTFIPASGLAVPGTFTVGQTVFYFAGIIAGDSARHFKDKRFVTVTGEVNNKHNKNES